MRPAARHLSLLLLLALAAPLAAQVPADDAVTARLRAGGTRHDGARVVLWVEPGALDDTTQRRFARTLDDGVLAVERTLGAAFDTAHYEEDAIHVFVASDVTVSHVYGGYAHQQHARPYLYLSAERVRAGAAPYLHELTHLVAWRFGSHSLREGVASWVETAIAERGEHRGAALFGVTTTRRADELALQMLASPAGGRVLPWVGRGGFADRAITEATPANRASRAAYYVLSQSFAQHLVREAGVAAVARLYGAPDTEAAYVAVTGRDREAWIRGWMAALEP